MIVLKWHRHVDSPDYPAYVSNAVIGKVFGIDGSSVRRLYMKRFDYLNRKVLITRKRFKELQALPK